MKTIQVSAKMDDGELIRGDSETVDISEIQIAQMVATLKSINKLDHLMMYRDGKQLFLNPNKIVYIELSIT